MNFDIEPNVIEQINAIWATPYGLAAQYLFYFCITLKFIELVFYQKNTVWKSFLLLIGQNKDQRPLSRFDLLLVVLMLCGVGLLIYSLQVVGGVT